MVAFLVKVFVRDSEINEVDFMVEGWILLKVTNHDVVWLDITMNVPLPVQLLQQPNHLYPKIKNANLREMLLRLLQDVF